MHDIYRIRQFKNTHEQLLIVWEDYKWWKKALILFSGVGVDTMITLLSLELDYPINLTTIQCEMYKIGFITRIYYCMFILFIFTSNSQPTHQSTSLNSTDQSSLCVEFYLISHEIDLILPILLMTLLYTQPQQHRLRMGSNSTNRPRKHHSNSRLVYNRYCHFYT